MQEFPLKTVLLEYSPREKRVFVRWISNGDERVKLAPIHEDNTQSYVRAYEGFDNVGNAIGFGGLVPAWEE